MTFSALPIVARELRVRARKPWTVWLRVIVGLLTALTTLSTLTWAQRSTGAALPGKAAFTSLSSLLLVFCLIEGVRQTADCLSSERREGTLGLLFLTPLSGLDVLLGKLAATSLNSFYSFMAVFPVLAVTLAAGGLTGGEFWRSLLVLLNTLLLALACGMWMSARQREEARSMLRSLILVLGITFLPWILEPLLAAARWPNVSMSVALHLADDAVYRTHSGRFWMSLAAGHALAWLLLVAASRKIESSWRDDTVGVETAVGGPKAVVRPRPRIGREMPDNAAFWLAHRTWQHRKVVWLMLCLLALSPFSFIFYSLFATNIAIHYTLEWVPLVVILFIASRPLGEARRSGAMELLLSTPLSPIEIVQGFSSVLWLRMSGCLTVALSAALILVLLATAASPVWGPGLSLIPYFLIQGGRLLFAGLAACWLGLYLGLRFESAVKATGLGLIWIVAVPWVAAMLFWMVARPFMNLAFTGGPPFWFWIVQSVPSLFTIAWCIGLMRWSRRQLKSRFRELAGGTR